MHLLLVQYFIFVGIGPWNILRDIYLGPGMFYCIYTTRDLYMDSKNNKSLLKDFYDIIIYSSLNNLIITSFMFSLVSCKCSLFIRHESSAERQNSFMNVK